MNYVWTIRCLLNSWSRMGIVNNYLNENFPEVVKSRAFEFKKKNIHFAQLSSPATTCIIFYLFTHKHTSIWCVKLSRNFDFFHYVLCVILSLSLFLSSSLSHPFFSTRNAKLFSNINYSPWRKSIIIASAISITVLSLASPST